MKQYCRYCGHACLQGDDVFYCSERKKLYSGATAKRLNTCRSFGYCGMDLFNPDREYSPNKNKTHRLREDGYEQQSIFEKGAEQ